MSEQKEYAKAGVDIALAERLLDSVKPILKKATRAEVLGKVGNFGGLFDIGKLQCPNPVMVSSTDSVGTKVKVATMCNVHDFIGHDIVNHCCNDIAVMGAEPLFFLDYFATSKLTEEVYKPLLTGIAEACSAAKCALVGGETAELPGVYQEGEYDLVGTVVGVVNKNRIITGETISVGDRIIGVASSGLHTNGYSLARKIAFADAAMETDTPLPDSDMTIGQALLKPHTNYSTLIGQLLTTYNQNEFSSIRENNSIFGIAHLTGGGFIGNIPRILPKDLDAVVDTRSWSVPPLFRFLTVEGKVPFEERYEVFNMGVGLALVVRAGAAESIMNSIVEAGQTPYLVGEVVGNGTGKVNLLH